MSKRFAICQLTENASIRGLHLPLPGSANHLYKFCGIPFAEPPVNALRFKPPKPAQSWSGIRDCCDYGPIPHQDIDLVAKQMYPYEVPQNTDEDCLYLNVFTPTLEPSAQLAVMVWIYGGAFIQGFSNFYDGSVLAADYNVVVVTINYRVGPLGFLCTGDEEVTGNAGLLDQVEALKWVNKHIHKFGGDPNNVTIFGESAGAISVNFHTLSPLSKGLFHKAICQSGVSTHPGSAWPKENAVKYLHKRLAELGCTSKKGSDIVQFLSKFNGKELVAGLGLGYHVVIDGHFLPDYPVNLYKQGLFHHSVDTIMGFNSHEGAMFIFEMARPLKTLDMQRAEMILNQLIKVMFFRKNPKADAIIDVLKDTYFPKNNDREDILKGLVDLHGDLLFVAPTVYCVELLKSHKDAKCPFMYEFNLRPSISRNPAWVDADHGQEIMFVFGEPFLGRFPDIWSPTEKDTSQRIMQLWTSFAKVGKPVSKDGIEEWTPAADGSYFDIAAGQVKKQFKPDRMAVWRKILEETLGTTMSKY